MQGHGRRAGRCRIGKAVPPVDVLLRHHITRGERIDPHTLARKLQRQRFRQAKKSVFGHRIGKGAGNDGKAVGRGDVQDRTAPRRDHSGKGRTAAVPRTLHVHVKGALPFVVRGFQRRVKHVDPGVVDHCIDRADGRGGLCHGRFDPGAVRDVCHCPAKKARRVQHNHASRQQFCVPVDKEQCGAFPQAGCRDGKSDTLRGTGQKDAFSGQAIRHISSFSSGLLLF